MILSPVYKDQPVDNNNNNNSIGLVAPENSSIVGTINTIHDNGWDVGYWANSQYVATDSSPAAIAYFLNILLNNYSVWKNRSNNAASYMSNSMGLSRTLQFASGNSVGFAYRNKWAPNNLSGGYVPECVRALPIYNNANYPITTFANIMTSSGYSSYSGSQYGGQIGVLYPDNSIYSKVNSISYRVMSTWNTTAAATSPSTDYEFIIPAKTCVLLLLINTAYWDTGYVGNPSYASNQYLSTLTSQFTRLDRLFADPNLMCDMKMLSTLALSPFDIWSTHPKYGTSWNNPFTSPHYACIWNEVARLFGDR